MKVVIRNEDNVMVTVINGEPARMLVDSLWASDDCIPKEFLYLCGKQRGFLMTEDGVFTHGNFKLYLWKDYRVITGID